MSKFHIFSAVLLLVFGRFIITAQTIELPMQLRGPMPAVEVMINGKGPFIFAIDTGAQGQARLDSSLVEKLALKPSGQIAGGDGSGRNTRMMDTYQVDSIKVGDFTFSNVTAPSRNYNVSPSLPQIDGILGYGLFADSLLTLDYPGKKVRIEKGALPAPNQTNILDLDSSRGTAMIEIQVGSEKIKARIDSGNTIGSIVLPTALVEKSRPASEPVTIGRGRSISSDIEIKQVRIKDTVRLGSYEFIEPTVTYPALSSDANIGSRLLSEFAVTFDQKNNRVKFERGTVNAEQNAMNIENPKDYAGNYGERIVTEETGALFIQRPGGMKLKLVPITKDEFTLEQVPAARLKFTRDANGKIIEMQILNPQGIWEKAAKATS